jgi:hypothetical protein
MWGTRQLVVGTEKSVRWAAPVVFVPRTLWRTWGTRPIPVGFRRRYKVAARAKGLVQQGGLLPVEVAAENGFDDPVVGAGCRAYTHSDVDFPFGRDIEVGHYEDLLLLVMERIECTQAAVVCVVFDAAADLPVKVVAEFDAWGKADSLFYIWTVPRPF